MPQSKTRKTVKKKPRTVPDLTRPVTTNAVEAEAGDYNIAFEWRNTPFVIDIRAVKFGKAAFSLRVASNEQHDVLTRMNACLEVLESALGQPQLMKVLEIAPDFFDDVDTLSSFWDAYTKAVHGAASGESQAS